MKNFSCGMPRIIFGRGTLDEIGKQAARFGNKAFLVLDPFLLNLPVRERILDKLSAEGLQVSMFSEIEADPDTSDVDRAAKIASEYGADLVIGVGGGSALDFAKGVALMAVNPGNAWEYTRRKDHVAKVPGPNTLPIIGVPSTAGTGSEATPFSVLSNRKIMEKSTIVDNRLIPSVAIVDPELTFSMPKELTAFTGVDVLAHSVEAFINTVPNPFAMITSREAVLLVGKYLVRAYNDGNDAEARSSMAWASCLAGMAIAHANPTLPHALGQAAGGFAHIPHGASVAAVFKEVIMRSCTSDTDRFAELACLLNPRLAGGKANSTAAAAGQEIEILLDKINCRPRLGDFGITEDVLPRIADIALVNYATGISQHPYKAGKQEIIDIYRNCI